MRDKPPMNIQKKRKKIPKNDFENRSIQKCKKIRTTKNTSKGTAKDLGESSVDTPSLTPQFEKEKSSLGSNLVASSLSHRKEVTFPHRYILAPMVGASELAFRLLCRRYGTQLAYTPMMSAQKFATSATYRQEEFQTCPEDRPLVCHFAANHPDDFAAAARLAEPFCDAIDLNLGCPQRTAYIGHFGSYLLEEKDRDLVCSIVRSGARAVQIPIFCKIRLLNTLPETIQLCEGLRNAGASLIAIHARYRASWERKGPGARDGPALLDQVLAIKKAVRDIPIIANGNTITYSDVKRNLELTQADGLMSAEGILDNPALFLPRLHQQDEEGNSGKSTMSEKKKRKLDKKIQKLMTIENKLVRNDATRLDENGKHYLEKKLKVEHSVRQLLSFASSESGDSSTHSMELLDMLKSKSADKLVLAREYLLLATLYPVKMRSVIFHTRRILKALLDQYQLMEECISANSIDELLSIIQKIRLYQEKPELFVFDKAKAQKEKDALDRKRQEEGKRKAYEARMMRKAKREGKSDLMHYLHIGAELPTCAILTTLKALPHNEAMNKWKTKHSQHCFAFHMDENGCQRGRACAFLHVEVLGSNAFEEKEEVSG